VTDVPRHEQSAFSAVPLDLRSGSIRTVEVVNLEPVLGTVFA
jgi:hypothetical protein